MPTAVESVARDRKGPYRSRDELRQILDRVLREVDGDPDDGPRLRAAAVSTRLEVVDLELVVNITAAGDPRCLQWEFSDEIDWEPGFELRMNSEVAHLYLQGSESVAIGAVRGRIETSCDDARVLLHYLPLSRILFKHYRQVIKRRDPALLAK